MKFARLVALFACVGILIAGCGEAEEDDASTGSREGATGPAKKYRGPMREVFVTVEGLESPADIGILMAEKEGFFTDVGIRATVLPPAAPIRSVAYVVDRSSDFGVTQQVQVAMSWQKGAPIVAVGSLLSQSAASMIWLPKSKIQSISDLKGKTIAIAGLPSEEGLLESVLRRARLGLDDVHPVRAGYELTPALLGGRADAALGPWNQEGVELEARGAKPVIRRLQSLGVPDHEELVVIARRDRAAEDPQLVTDFMSAVIRGARAALEDPDSAVEILQEDFQTDPKTGPQTRRTEVEETLPLLSETGTMDAERVEDLVDWMREEGLIKRKPSPSRLFTNDFLPSS